MDDVDALLQHYGSPAAPQRVPDDVDALLSHYGGQPAAQATQQATEAAPGYFSPAEVGKRAVRGLAGSIPGAGSLAMAAGGRNPYTADAEGVSRGIGDASQGALTLATAGHGLGLGAVINAGLEAAGVNDLAHKTAQGAENTNLGFPVANLPSKELGIEGLGTLANAASRIPGTAGSFAADLVPAALTMGIMKGAGSKAFEPTPMQKAATQLNAEGGEAPVSAQINSPMGRGVAASMERSAKTNPLTKGSYEGQDAANTDVLQKHFQQNFGPDIFEPVAAKTGANTLATIEKMAARRQAAYQPVVEDLRAQGQMQGLGDAVAGAVKKAMAQEPLVDQVGGPWSKFANDIQSKKVAAQDTGVLDANGKMTQTPEQAVPDNPFALLRKFTSMRLGFKESNPLTAGAMEHDYGQVEGAAKDALYSYLDQFKDSTGNPLGQSLRKANFDYADASQPLNRLNGALSKNTSPEYVMPTLLRTGSKPVADMMADMTPAERVGFQQDAARYMLDSIKKQGGITAKGLEQLPVRFRNVIPAVFGDAAGKAILARIQNGTNLMRAANVNEIGNFNPSGSGHLIQEQGKLGALFGGLGKAATTLPDLGYTYGARPLAKAATRSIPFTPKMPGVLLPAAVGAREVGRQLNQENLAQ